MVFTETIKGMAISNKTPSINASDISHSGLSPERLFFFMIEACRAFRLLSRATPPAKNMMYPALSSNLTATWKNSASLVRATEELNPCRYPGAQESGRLSNLCLIGEPS
jgi:hypothetical protein